MAKTDELLDNLRHTVSILEQQNFTLESKIESALRELAHILGEKTPTEKRIEQALKK